MKNSFSSFINPLISNELGKRGKMRFRKNLNARQWKNLSNIFRLVVPLRTILDLLGDACAREYGTNEEKQAEEWSVGKITYKVAWWLTGPGKSLQSIRISEAYSRR